VVYEPNNGGGPPQDDFNEGIFIDYRGLDKYNKTPIYEFGFGLSYTTFSFSDLNVQSVDAAPYTPTTGSSPPAPTYGTISNDSAEYVYPTGFQRVQKYIYPYINSTDLADSSDDPAFGSNYTWPAGSYDSSAQPYVPAGGAPGGNPRLYDVLFTITATITNTGSVAGDEVGQVYVSLGGPNDAKKILRNFDRLTIEPGASKTFTADLTRKDLSNWDTVKQDWYVLLLRCGLSMQC
jgi:beta-glucosidase